MIALGDSGPFPFCLVALLSSRASMDYGLIAVGDTKSVTPVSKPRRRRPNEYLAVHVRDAWLHQAIYYYHPPISDRLADRNPEPRLCAVRDAKGTASEHGLAWSVKIIEFRFRPET